MSQSINVVWYNQSKGNWDSGLLRTIFDKHPDLFIQHNFKGWAHFDRAIVIVVGKPEVAPLRECLDTLKSGIVILTSDEDAYFDYKAAIPPHLEIWSQYWTQDRPEIKERLLIGPSSRLFYGEGGVEYKNNSGFLRRDYLWSFVGQVQNPFRQECIKTLLTLEGGFLQVVQMFGGNGENGMDYQAYLDIMCRSKYVICPSGSMSVDSFRLYEAIECGAIPITDMHCPREKDGFNWWRQVVPDADIMMVSSWSDLNQDWFKEPFYEERLKKNSWWKKYKEQLESKLVHAAYEN